MKKVYETPSLIVERFDLSDPDIITSNISDLNTGTDTGAGEIVWPQLMQF